MQTFGALIRQLRTSKGFLIREVATQIKVDPSFLSRIEKGIKRPTRDHVIRLAKALEADKNELLIHYLSDLVVYELDGEEFAFEAIAIAEKKLRYHKLHRLDSNDSKP